MAELFTATLYLSNGWSALWITLASCDGDIPNGSAETRGVLGRGGGAGGVKDAEGEGEGELEGEGGEIGGVGSAQR